MRNHAKRSSSKIKITSFDSVECNEQTTEIKTNSEFHSEADRREARGNIRILRCFMENTIMAEMLEEMKKQNSALYGTLAELVNNQLSGMQTILSKMENNHEQPRTDANEEKSISRMEKNEIRGHLYLNGLSQVDIAKKTKVTVSMVSRVMSRERKSKRVANFIAKQIGGKREEIFGY